MSRKNTSTPDTKRCPQCGRTLPAESFAMRSCGTLLQSYCQECRNLLNRTKYRVCLAKHKKGEVFRREDGQLWVYTGAQWKRFWSRQMIQYLVSNYSETTNQELAGVLGVPLGTLNRKARELGLHKSRKYLVGIARKNLVLAHAESAIHGNAGQFKPGEHRSRATEFKKKDPKQE